MRAPSHSRRWMILPLFFALALAAAGPSTAADAEAPAGSWRGSIELPGQELDFDVDLVHDGDAWSGDITIPKQGASNVPLEAIAIDGATITFKISGVPGEPTFEGTIEGETIAGDLHQGGQTFPFSMTTGSGRLDEARAALEGIGPIIDEALREFGIPGLALAVVVDGEVVHAEGYGRRNIEEDLPVTADTLFAIGSTTKAFTAFVLATLVDEGKIQWDQPVAEILDDFRLFDDHASRQLRVRDLLIHSSGLPRHDLAWYNSPASRDELYRRLRYLEPTRDLREQFQYQNLMYMTAGVLAERVTGQSWEELVRERILDPLGMDRTNFSIHDSPKDPDHALPYGVEDREPRPIPFRDIDQIGPAGSINSSVNEMTRWIRLLLGGGELDGRRLLESSTVHQLHTPYITTGAYPTDDTTLSIGYGLGWSIEAHRGHYLAQHGGGIDGFISWVALLPLDGIGAVAYTNGSGANPLPTAVVRTALDRVLGLEPIDYLDKAREQLKQFEESQAETAKNAESKRQLRTSPTHALADYAGEYEHPGYGVVTVEASDETLRLTYNRIPVVLEHWHFDTFNGVDPDDEASSPFEDLKFQFRLDRDGEVVELLAPFEPAVDPIVFERKADSALFDPEYLQRFTGVYQGTQRSEITLVGDRLQLSLPGQPLYTLEPIREREFAIGDLPGYTIEFVEDDDGAITGALIHQPQGTFEAKRVEE